MASPSTRTSRLHALVVAWAALWCSQAVAQEWSLFGRHGECAPISSLKRKLQDLPEIRTPEEFSAYLESKRLKFTRQAHRAAWGGVVEFQVPDAGLAIVFVPRRLCGKDASPAR